MDNELPIFKIDGREFRGISQSLSAAQDEYLLAHLRRSGAVEALGDSELPGTRKMEEMLTRIMIAGASFAVMAGCLTEEGKRWTRADAERNAKAFAAVTDPEEKRTMQSVLVGLVIDFFVSGERLRATSRKSSSPSAAESPTESAAPMTLETSPPSFAKLAEATAIGSPR